MKNLPLFKSDYIAKLLSSVEYTYLDAIYQGKLDFAKSRHFLYRYYIAHQHRENWSLFVKTTCTETEKLAKGLMHFSKNDSRDLSCLDYVYECLRTNFYLHLFDSNERIFSQKELLAIQKSLFSDNDYWLTQTYKAICIVFYLFFQQHIDWIEEAEKKFARLFDQKKNPDIRNYLYGVTHFIICGTNYYQYAPGERYKKYLLEIERYKENIDPKWIDLIIEIALVGKFYGEYVWRFDELEGFIRPRVASSAPAYIKSHRDDTINGSEHVNSLFVLLASDWMFLK